MKAYKTIPNSIIYLLLTIFLLLAFENSKAQSSQLNIQSDSLHVDQFIDIMHSKNIRVYYDPSWFGENSWKKVNLQNLSEEEAISAFFRLFGVYTFKHNNAWYLSKESGIKRKFAKNFIKQLSADNKSEFTQYQSFEKLTQSSKEEQEFNERKEYELIRFGHPSSLNRKENFSLSGFIFDDETKEPIVGATVILSGTTIGTSTNFSGYFNLNLPADQHEIVFQAIGKEPTRRRVSLYASGNVRIHMIDKYEAIEEVNVYANRKNKITQMTGAEEVKIEFLKKMPAVLGEVDVIKGLMALPGIQSTTEVSSGFNVRGGSTDQNLVLMDGAPVMNTSHFFWFLFHFQ